MEKIKQDVKKGTKIVVFLLTLTIICLFVFLFIKSLDNNLRQILISIFTSLTISLGISLVMNLYFSIYITKISISINQTINQTIDQTIDQKIEIKTRNIYNIEGRQNITNIKNESNNFSSLLTIVNKDSMKLLKIIDECVTQLESEYNYFKNTGNKQKQLNIEILNTISDIYEVGETIITNISPYEVHPGDIYKEYKEYKGEIENSDAINDLNSILHSTKSFIEKLQKNVFLKNIKDKLKIVTQEDIKNLTTIVEDHKKSISLVENKLRAIEFYD